MAMKNACEENAACKKVLLIAPSRIVRGGVEVFLLNLVRSVPKGKYRFVWYCIETNDKAFAREFEAEGVRIIEAVRLPENAGVLKKVIVRAKDFWRLSRAQHFDVMHVNTGKRAFLAYYVLLARLCGIKNRIAHGHGYIIGDHPKLEYRLYRSLIVHVSTEIAACSALAAKHICGPRYMDRAVIFPNGIDTAHFAFSSETRRTIREELGFEGMLVFGVVGRLNKRKNHAYLIEVFRLIAEKNDRARLLLVGDGKLREEIEEKVRSYGLADKVVFTGSTGRVNEYLCAMDVFVLPTRYDAFGIVNLEAQASGLPCIVSDGVAPEAKIAEDFTFLPLKAGHELWANRLLETRPKPDAERLNAWKLVRDAGYDLKDVGRCAQRLYG